MQARSIRTRLKDWYERSRRDLPWRRTRDPYAIWISETMLQQTRVAAVIPYYEKFLTAFPDAAELAKAPEEKVLALWAGLGYYSRARNLQKAAKQIEAAGAFPREFEAILELAGVGAYTAAAVASIAFGLPHAVVDGNVRRVLVRICNDNDIDVQSEADRLLDRSDPGRSNQALMELGATICTPRDPNCGACPVASCCEARKQGTQAELPRKKVKPDTVRLERTLLIIQRGERVLLVQSVRVKGFWELPEPFEGVRMGPVIGEFRHMITHRQYRFIVREASLMGVVKDMRWVRRDQLHEIPLSTAAKKALRCLAD